MNIQDISSHYGVPATIGGRVSLPWGDQDITGTILGASSGLLEIQMDGDHSAALFHPLHSITYMSEAMAA